MTANPKATANKAHPDATAGEAPSKPDEQPLECFVIMPISDPDGYDAGHFLRVYQDILKPACEQAGLKPIRGDEVRATNFIVVDIIQRLLEAPIVLCDLSNRNPNVLFELGLRQAFDKPVVLVQEEGTPRIFDVSGLRITNYRKERLYHEVISDQKAIREVLLDTIRENKGGKAVNSLMRLLSMTPPKPTFEDKEKVMSDPTFQVLYQEIQRLGNRIDSGGVQMRSGVEEVKSVVRPRPLLSTKEALKRHKLSVDHGKLKANEHIRENNCNSHFVEIFATVLEGAKRVLDKSDPFDQNYEDQYDALLVSLSAAEDVYKNYIKLLDESPGE